MTKNRRFPFERSNQIVSLENFSTTEQQLYPMIRQYLSVSRQTTNQRSQPVPQTIVPYEDDYQLNQFMDYLKQKSDINPVDSNNPSALREHNIQHWKNVKCEWQKYYREKNRKHQELFDNLIKSSHR